MARLKRIMLCAFLAGLLLSPVIPVAAAGTAADPLASQSWVEEYLDRQLAPIKASISALRQAAYEKLGISPVDIRLSIGSPTVTVNGITQETDCAPKIIGAGYTMVPARFVAESIGVQVEWDAATRQIRFFDASKTMLLTIGSTTALIDGQEYAMPTAPIIDNSLSVGRTLVHVRFVAEAFGCTLDWEPKNKRTETVFIKR